MPGAAARGSAPQLAVALAALSALADAALAEPLPTNITSAQAEAVHPFWVFRWEEVWKPEVALCSVVLLLSGVLSSAAGTGGGGIFVAVLMLVGQLSPHNAVPLSKAIVFFGAVASLLVNLRRTLSPGEGSKRGVLDLDACRIVVPSSLVGTFLGVLLNWHAEESTIVATLSLVLVFMTGMVFRTAWLQRCEELEEPRSGSSQVPETCVTRFSNPQEDFGESSSTASRASRRETSDEEDMEDEQRPLLTYSGASSAMEVLERHRAECFKEVPSRIDAVLGGFLMFIVVTAGVMRFHMHMCRTEKLEGTNKGSCQHPIALTLFGGRLELWMSNESTSVILQLMNLSVPLWSCSAIAAYYAYVIRRVAKWQAGRVAAYQAVALGTGLLAGLVGVGGGLILSPFFLLTGMEPSVAVGTSATCVLFTAASTTFQYAFTDRIIMSLALVYGMVTLLASYIGTSLVHLVQDRFAGRRSYITFVVAIGVALSAVLALGKLCGLLRSG